MKQVLLLLSIVLLFFTVNAEAQLKPAQSQYSVNNGVLVNSNFEQGYKGWDISGGCSKSLVTVTPYLNKTLRLTCVAATFSVKQLSTSLISFAGQQAAFDLQVKADANGVKVSSISNSIRDTEYSVITDTTFKRFKQIGVAANATNNGIEIYSDSVFTGVVDIDNAYLGLSNLTQELSGAHFVGSLFYNSASCIWSATNTGWGDFAVDPDCIATDITGDVTAPVTKIPAISINNPRLDGIYRVITQGLILRNAGSTCYFSLSSSANYENQGAVYTDAVVYADSTIEGNFRFTDTASKEIRIITLGNGGPNCAVYGAGNNDRKFTVHFFPDSKSTIATQKTSSPDYAGFLSFSFMDGDLEGHLPADGRCVAKNLYPDYDKRVANLYGDCDAGTGANSGYNLPDMRGYFPRMVDTTSEGTAGVNPDNTVLGGKQADQNLSHNHQYTWGANAGGGAVGMNQLYNFLASANNIAAQTTASRGGNEARPSAISLMAYVRMADNNLVVGDFEQIEEITGDLTKETSNQITIRSNTSTINSTDFGATSDYTVSIGGGSAICLNYSSLGLSDIPAVGAFIEHRAGFVPNGIPSYSIPVTTSQTCVYTVDASNTIYNPAQIKWVINKQGADVNKSFKGAVINAADSSQLIADTIRAEIVSDDLLSGSYYSSVAQTLPISSEVIKLYDTELTGENDGNLDAYFNTATGVYTSPRSTCYTVSASAAIASVNGDRRPYLFIVANNIPITYGSETIAIGTSPLLNISNSRICLGIGQELHVKINSGDNAVRNTQFGEYANFSIQELPDRQSILENFNNANTTKCQTKVLSTSVGTLGDVGDLTFSNLSLGKRYSVKGKLHAVFSNSSANEKYIILNVNNGATLVDSYYLQANAISNYRDTVTPSLTFTASGVTLDFNIIVLANLSVAGNGTRANTFIELCELPDTVITTTEF